MPGLLLLLPSTFTQSGLSYLLLQFYRTICVKLTWPNNFITRLASRKEKFCVIFNVYYASHPQGCHCRPSSLKGTPASDR